MKKTLLISLVVTLTSCSYKHSENDFKKLKSELTQDNFTYNGKYSWSFQLMGGNQLSTHTFFEDSIVYEMEGIVHSTKYSMNKLSYDDAQKKWIGESPDKVIYVLFFKEKTDHTITIYKHKCKSNGLTEAIQFAIPEDDATEDHGWNTYASTGYNTEDLFPVTGIFTNQTSTISINDTLFVIDEKRVEKMSFHSGERRWVGKYKNQYLQVFFQNSENTNSLKLSIKWHDDLERLYTTKYNSVENWTNYEKQ